MEHFRHFAFCPRCGAATAPGQAASPFRCATCGFLLYFNAAAAVAVLVRRPDGAALFIRRARDPGRGMLGMPGGFVDVGESAEQALRREVREEVGLELGPLRYLLSAPNHYLYAGVTYHTLDLVYEGAPVDDRPAEPLDAVSGIEWLPLSAVAPEALAFPCMREAVKVVQEREGMVPPVGHDAE